MNATPSRDTGMLRAVGLWGLAAAIVNNVVGAGIFALPAALAAGLGAHAPLAFAGCALAVGAVAVCFAEGGSRVPTSGGAYGYITAAFGPLAGYVAGTLLWFGNLLACGGIAAALANVLASAVPVALTPALLSATRAVIVIGVIGAIALINLRGVVPGTRFIGVATPLKLLPLLVFVAAGAPAVHAAYWHASAAAGGTAGAAAAAAAGAAAVSSRGVGHALILGVFAFSGMETPLCASGEVRSAARTIPRALALAMLSITLLYVAIQAVAQGILGPALAVSTVPLADAMAQVSPSLRLLMLAGAAVSMLGWLGSDLLGTPRVLFAFARDGLLPRALGRVPARSHAPQVAILCYATLAIALALSGTFAELAVLSSLVAAPLYIGGCAAAWRLAHRGVALAGAPLNLRALPLAAVLGIASMAALVALAARAEIIGLAVLMAGSVVAYRLSARRPMVAAQ